MSEKLLKKTYYPTKTFDDNIDGLAKLYQDKGWAFSGIDGRRLLDDAAEQRKERAQHDALESQYFNLHESFGMAQEARHQRFAAALNAARGAFRDDKAIMAELSRFKRVSSSQRRTKAATVPTPVRNPTP